MTVEKTPSKGRRNLMKGAAVAAGAMTAPMVATAQTATTLRFQSTWPAKDIFHEYAQDFAKKVNDMAGNRLKIEVLPSGSVVPAADVSVGSVASGFGAVEVSTVELGSGSAVSDGSGSLVVAPEVEADEDTGLLLFGHGTSSWFTIISV